MLGNFTFHNPTKLYFGENSLENLGKELGKYGEKVMLVYGGGSIRKNGIYDAVLAELRKAGKQTVELSGVMPNPTIEKVMEGVALARKEAVDFILAVGGKVGQITIIFGQPLDDRKRHLILDSHDRIPLICIYLITYYKMRRVSCQFFV